MNLEKLNNNTADWLPSLKALRALEAVSRHGGFQAAAEELCVTPAAVHQLVRGLETALGVPLVRRDGQGVALTPAAEAGVLDIGEGFAGLHRGVRRIRRYHERRFGRRNVRLSVEPSFAGRWLVDRLYRFHARHPDIDVLVDASARVVDLTREEADMAIRYAREVDPHLRAAPLFPDETIAICNPGILRDGDREKVARDGTIDASSFAMLTRLHFDWPHGPQIQVGWHRWLERVGWSGTEVGDVDIAQGPRFTDYNMMIQAATAGQGVALASRPMVADALAAGLLVDPIGKSVDDGYRYFALSADAPGQSAALDRLYDWICEEAQSRTPRVQRA